MKYFLRLLTFTLLVCGFGCNSGIAQTFDKVIEGNSGSGVILDGNLILNNNAEKPILASQVSVTGGTLSRTCKPTGSSDVLLGNCSFSWTATASGQIMKIKSRPIPNIFKGQTCAAYFSYQYATIFGADNNAFKTYVTDGTNKKSSEVVLRATYDSSGSNSGDSNETFILGYPCSNATTPEIWVEHTASSTTIFGSDEFTLGKYNGMRAVPDGSSWVGSLHYAGATSCTWTRTNAALGAFPVNASCSTPTTLGQLTAPATKIPGFTIPTVKPGKYVVVVSSFFSTGTSGADGTLAISDGTQTVYAGNIGADTTNSRGPTIQSTLTYSTTQSNVTIQIYGAASSGNLNVSAGVAGLRELKFDVFYYPLNGTAYSNVVHASCINNPDCQNNFSAKISATGVVSDENYSFINGNCVISGTSINTCTWDTARFSVAPVCVLTSETSQVSWNAGNPTATGAVFTTTNSGGTAIAGITQIHCSRSGTDVKPWGPVPLLSGMVSSNSTSSIRNEFASFSGGAYATNCTASPCTVVDPSSPFLTSVIRNSQGNYTFNFANATWSGANYLCTHSLNNFVTGSGFCYIPTRSQTSMNMICVTGAGAAVDVSGVIDCKGPR